MLSITHRFTGMLLSVGLVPVVWWLLALARGPEHYDAALALFAHPVFVAGWMVWTWSLFYHLLNGIRHLLWDMGLLFDLGPARASGWAVAVLSVILTVVVFGGVL